MRSPSSPLRPSTAARSSGQPSAAEHSTPSCWTTPRPTRGGVPELSIPAATAGPSSSNQPSPEPATSVLGSGTVRRRPVGLSIEDVESGTPSRLAMLCVDHICPQPTAQPGLEFVQPTMPVLVFIELLRAAQLIRDDELSAYSEEMVRESALYKEFADPMAPCNKLELLATLGRRTFTLRELFADLPMDAMDEELREKEFLVPPGRLSAGQGQRDANGLSRDELCLETERIRAGIVSAVAQLDSPDADSIAPQRLEIGLVGVGNKGKDSMLVLVEAQNTSRAWGLVVQSKQSLAATTKDDKVPSILESMFSDLKGTHTLPQLHADWVKWQDTPGENPSDTMPTAPCSASDASTWDDAAPDQRVIYAYVSDKLFDHDQEDIRKQLVYRQHPWLRRLLIVSHAEQECWYSRAGALLRSIRAAAQMSKRVRKNLRGLPTRPQGQS